VNFLNLFPARFHNKFFLFFSLLLPGILGGFSQPLSAKIQDGKVLKVFDGDTALVRTQGREEHVRLREIDAPEVANGRHRGQEPWGKDSKKALQVMIVGKTVRLEIEEGDERDKYKRILAYVYVGDVLVNLAMIHSGKAFFYPSHFRGQHAKKLQEAEEEAKEKELGVWDRKNGCRERPQDFRKRTNRDDSLFSKIKGLWRGKEKKSTPQKNPVPAGKIVGNKRSMIYHLPGSPYATQVSPQNRVFFETEEEAAKAGFRKAR
jgi:micrococcal nuclease